MKLAAKNTVTILKEFEDGDYIIRHEIIALHLADQKGGAEFYSSCFQLRVTGGTGTALTTASETIKFPGAYSAKDKGIYTPKVFDNGFKYTFPGPAIATFANTGNSTDPEPSSTATETDVEPTATASEPAEPTATTVPDDDDECNEDPTSIVSAAPEPTETDDCTDEDPEPSASATSSSKSGKPTSNAHKNNRRAQAAVRGWSRVCKSAASMLLASTLSPQRVLYQLAFCDDAPGQVPCFSLLILCMSYMLHLDGRLGLGEPRRGL